MSVTAPHVSDLDSERLRIARELHDVIAYGFATINLQAGTAVHVAREKPHQALEALETIRVASKTALDELRGILGLLRHADESVAPKVGLEGLEALIDMTSKAGVVTRLNVGGSSNIVPAAIGRAAYRIVQEALTNVLRHAGDAVATVSITVEDDRLSIAVEDDGVGIGAAASEGSGYGILGMHERVHALGGSLEAGPRPEGGFRVHASLPIRTFS